MRSLGNVTLGDIARAAGRYRPFVGAATVVILVVVLLPGRDATSPVDNQSLSSGPAAGSNGASAVDPASGDAIGADGGANAADEGAATPGGGPATGDAAPGAATPAALDRAAEAGTPLVANCDPATGRIAVPTLYAPPCVPAFGGDNGGATWRGVTKDKITLVLYMAPVDPATLALGAASGVFPDPDAAAETMKAMVGYFNAHYETYGRTVELVVHEASGRDEQAQKADAVAIAEEKKAFAVVNGITGNAMAEELAARGVICIPCRTAVADDSFYMKNAPHLWHYASTMSQGFRASGEYVGRRLWGRKARWSGDPLMAEKPRKIGIAYPAAGEEEEAAVDAFIQEVNRYGGKVGERVGYTPETNRAAEQARVVIAKLKSSGVTTVALAATPVQISSFTIEASNQLYFPEWIPLNPVLHLNLIGRLADQRQWAHAFGPAQTGVPLEGDLNEGPRLHIWQYGTPPSERLFLELGYPMLRVFFDGVHAAGPALTPSTFRDGLWSLPPAGGGPTTPSVSYGRHGFWELDDYGGPDDFAEIWWDPDAQGTDEAGRSGSGMYRYVEGGRRSVVTKFPTGEPSVFKPAGTVITYSDYPEGNRPPDYPSPAQR